MICRKREHIKILLQFNNILTRLTIVTKQLTQTEFHSLSHHQYKITGITSLITDKIYILCGSSDEDNVAINSDAK